MEDLLAILETIPDHRADKRELHNLEEIIVMYLHGILCGGVTWLDIQGICETGKMRMNLAAIRQS